MNSLRTEFYSIIAVKVKIQHLTDRNSPFQVPQPRIHLVWFKGVG